MRTSWLVAIGIDVPFPLGLRDRSLLGHQIVLTLRSGAKSMRELHAATHRVISGAALRDALGELGECGLVRGVRSESGPRGGRPRETWTLLFPGSLAVRVAEAELEKAATRRRSRPRVSQAAPRHPTPSPPTARRLPRLGRRPAEVPPAAATSICAWLAKGRTLSGYASQAGAPARRTIYAWAAKSPEFRERLRQARLIGQQILCERLLEAVDGPSADRAFALGGQELADYLRERVSPLRSLLQRWGPRGRRQVLDF